MDIVKKNMWSIVCGVVAVLAVVSTYYPLTGKFVELGSKLQSSADEDRKFKTLINLNPNMPVIDPKTSEIKPLGMFPTERVIEKGKQVVGSPLLGDFAVRHAVHVDRIPPDVLT